MEKGESMKLIDADKLSKDGYSLERTYRKDSATMVIERRKIEDIPIVDAIPIIRCKDCKWYKTMFCKMDRWTDLITVYVAKADDYCSYGEKRKGEGDE